MAEYSSVKINGINLAFRREGNGEPILLIHGISSNSFIWNDITSHLSNKYDLIAVDLLGCGRSDKKTDISYSIKSQAQLLSQFINKLGLDKVHLIGHDVGGGIGQIMAVKNSELFYSLTIINTIAYDYWPVQPIITMRTPIIRQIALSTLDFGALKIIIKRGFYYKEKVTKELMNQFWQQMNSRESRKAFLHFAKSLNNKNLLEISDDLKKINFPVLIIRGDADVYLDKTPSLRLHEDIPNSILKIIPTAGHFAQIDEPDIIAEFVSDFISGNLNN